MWAALAIAGYWGNVFASKMPAITPEGTFKLTGVLGLTTAGRPAPTLSIMGPIPPGTPLLRSPMSVRLTTDCGIAASFGCLVSFGIVLGTCNSLLSNPDFIRVFG